MAKSKKGRATMRALMALATDLADYQALGDIRVQFETLAKVHGVEIPEPPVAI